MSQEELQHLLDELIEKSPYGSRQLSHLKRLAFEQQLWETRLAESGELHQRWENAKKSLQHLISENGFNEAMTHLGHPSRILGGPVKLDRPDQQLAMAELSVTLQQRQDVDASIAKLAQAINLYFQQYFKDGQHPPKEDPKCTEALSDFKKDPQKGASPEFLEYRAFTKYLETLTHSSGQDALPLWEKTYPPYAAILVFEYYHIELPKNLREHMIEQSPWKLSQLRLLEQLFEMEDSSRLAQKILSQILKLENVLSLDFINRQLRQNHHVDLLTNWLKEQDSKILVQFQARAVESNLDYLLGALNNLVGLDQAYLYKTLENCELQAGVFGQIVDSLFSQRPQQQYGIDQQHLQRVLEQQENLPKNLIAVLQRTLPRGLEGKSIPAALDFMERLNERIASLREQINTSEVLSPEQKGELSDTETVRFILCSHIHARLLTTKALEKVTELPLKNLVERFAKLHLFELTTGRNNNITKLIQHLWIKQPLLAPPISNS